MESEGSSPYTQEPATCPYPEPDQPSLRLHHSEFSPENHPFQATKKLTKAQTNKQTNRNSWLLGYCCCAVSFIVSPSTSHMKAAIVETFDDNCDCQDS
jgi:hypothetical protein